MAKPIRALELHYPMIQFLLNGCYIILVFLICVSLYVDCKTVRIFAYSSKREQSNKRSGTRLKTESEPYGRVRLARFARVRLLRHALPISLLILRKEPTVLQSTLNAILQLIRAK